MTASTSEKFTRFQEDILRTILYFDIFRHPLTAEEVYRYLPSDSTSPERITAECQRAPLSSFIRRETGYYTFAGNEKQYGLSEERLKKEERARGYRFAARFMARIIRRFPFVRGICVSGELSKGVASENGDVDYLIITANDRLWITRTLLILFKKLFLFNRKKFFCLNHFVSERSMATKERTLYSALEIATLIPLTDYERYLAYQEANAWIREYLPNSRAHSGDWLVGSGREGLIQRGLEYFLRGAFGDSLDNFLNEYWKRVWKRRYPEFSDEQRISLFRSEKDVSTSYVGDFLPKIMNQYRSRLESLGFESTDKRL